MVFSLLVLALAPAVALFLFFYVRDRYRKEPLSQLLITFLLGAVILIPAVVTSLLLQRLTGWNSSTTDLPRLFLGALLIVGLVEESWKFLVVRFYCFNQPEFDEPYDGIMYSVMASLGFATVENVLYVLEGGLHVGILRAVLAVPGHAFYAVLMGFFMGEAKFVRSNLRAAMLSLLGLGLAVLAHGLYDFMVFSLDRRPVMLAALPVFIALAWVVFFKATKRQSDQSFYRHPGLSGMNGEADVARKKDGNAAGDAEP